MVLKAKHSPFTSVGPRGRGANHRVDSSNEITGWSLVQPEKRSPKRPGIERQVDVNCRPYGRCEIDSANTEGFESKIPVLVSDHAGRLGLRWLSHPRSGRECSDDQTLHRRS